MTSQGSPYARLRRALDRRNKLSDKTVRSRAGTPGEAAVCRDVTLPPSDEETSRGSARRLWLAPCGAGFRIEVRGLVQ